MAHPQVSQGVGSGITLTRRALKKREPGGTSKKFDKVVAAKIHEDIQKLKRKDHGIRELLMSEYGLAGRHASDVSVDARSGFEKEAFETLKAAWISKNTIS